MRRRVTVRASPGLMAMSNLASHINDRSHRGTIAGGRVRPDRDQREDCVDGAVEQAAQ